MTAQRTRKRPNSLGIPTVTMSKKGWIVIPKEMRERHGLVPGREIDILDFDGRIVLVPVPEGDPIELGYGMLKGGPSLTEGLLRDRAEELEREERDLPPPPPRE
jgi:AbrB family looped-hinge helix DNA binding protein